MYIRTFCSEYCKILVCTPNGLNDARINALDYLCLRIVAFGLSLLKKKRIFICCRNVSGGRYCFLSQSCETYYYWIPEIKCEKSKASIHSTPLSLSLFYIHYFYIINISRRIFTAENFKIKIWQIDNFLKKIFIHYHGCFNYTLFL